jgi:N-acetylglucosaminyldiphosphoundecaprenol N-acetyl-beta-D-mannosaminyltransferase
MINKPISIETILGVKVSVLTQQGLIEALDQDIKNKAKKRIVAINPEKIIKCRKDKTLQTMLNGFDYHIADGVGVLLASKLHRGHITQRITGIDTMMNLCKLADENHYRIFLYGSQESVLSATKHKLKILYPNLVLVGSIDGYQSDKALIKQSILQAQPDILFVALGSPKQEYWITDAYEELNVSVLMGVGGSFDVISEKLNRAPAFFRKTGLEWFYRLLIEPKRLFRQTNLVVFALLVLTRWGKRYEQ